MKKSLRWVGLTTEWHGKTQKGIKKSPPGGGLLEGVFAG